MCPLTALHHNLPCHVLPHQVPWLLIVLAITALVAPTAQRLIPSPLHARTEVRCALILMALRLPAPAVHVLVSAMLALSEPRTLFHSPTPMPTYMPMPHCPVNCVGNYGTCGSDCTKTYTITTAAQNGGAACPHSDGDTTSCTGDACVGECEIGCVTITHAAACIAAPCNATSY